MAKITPMMRQYLSVKERYRDAIVLFRMGDFYETFYEDAKIVAKELNITLTSRSHGQDGKRIPLAGVPHHALDAYLAKLVRRGYKVVICEQVEDPKKAKGLVKREVVRIVTPGTVMEDTILSAKTNNFIMALSPEGKGRRFGLAFLDVSTAEFYATELEVSGERYPEILTEATRFNPVEVIIPEGMQGRLDVLEAALKDILENVTIRYHTDSEFVPAIAEARLKEHFGVLTLEGMGLEGKPLSISASWGVLSYVKDLQKDVGYITSVTSYSVGERMVLDYTTVRNLELLRNIVDNTEKGTLISVLDHTKTPMGARLLRRWMLNPELRIEVINARLDAVDTLLKHPVERDTLRGLMDRISDLERIMTRISYGSANPRDVLALKETLKTLPDLKEVLDVIISQRNRDETSSEHNARSKGFFVLPRGDGGGGRWNEALGDNGNAEGDAEGVGDGGLTEKGSKVRKSLLKELQGEMVGLDDVVDLIERAILEGASTNMTDGGIIRPGFSPELDALKDSISEAERWINSLESRERERTGIKSLKVGYNKVFGYYIEVPKTHSENVPEDYIRKQTLVNAERYITPDMKEKEAVVLSAKERINALEYEIFCNVRNEIASRIDAIRAVSNALAKLDVLANFAYTAQSNRYVRPDVNLENTIHIVEGRHPVVEVVSEDVYVPNDTTIDDKSGRIHIITGPNMAGKSTYMRQVALIVLMAQMGCFVPAKYARIGVIDRIFTRVGAHDDLLRGQSTFMVEMVQLANILNNATPRSLIILDEIGRGTSTYDGLSIAWAVVEHIHFRLPGAKVLFATHYHHLCELEQVYSDVRNYNVMVEERGESIVFVRKITPGATDRSYGIEVARLAGIPVGVVERAKKILKRIEEENVIDVRGVDGGIRAEGVGVKVTKKGKRGVKTYTQYVLFPFTEESSVENGAKGQPTTFTHTSSKESKGHRPSSAQTSEQSLSLTISKKLIEAIKNIDINNITPIEAMNALFRLKKMLEEGK